MASNIGVGTGRGIMGPTQGFQAPENNLGKSVCTSSWRGEGRVGPHWELSPGLLLSREESSGACSTRTRHSPGGELPSEGHSM